MTPGIARAAANWSSEITRRRVAELVVAEQHQPGAVEGLGAGGAPDVGLPDVLFASREHPLVQPRHVTGPVPARPGCRAPAAEEAVVPEADVHHPDARDMRAADIDACAMNAERKPAPAGRGLGLAEVDKV